MRSARASRTLSFFRVDLGQRVADMQHDIVADRGVFDQRRRYGFHHAVETDLRHVVGQNFNDADGDGETHG